MAKRLGKEGLQATLFAGVRSDMLEMAYMRDFLLTAKDISFARLEGVNAVGDVAV
jgi:LysR family transcriptional regulator for metE and metH